MKRIDRLPGMRWCLVLATAGALVAGCSKHGETARFINAADEKLTAREPANLSPANRVVTANCREWRKFSSREDFDERRWRFGCMNSATLRVSVADKRDLDGGRKLRRSEGWEAQKVLTDYRDGKLDPGQVDTSKSATTSSTK
ncbi:MAG: hypothetical protein RLT05_33510 [Bauldia litoralis]